MASLLHPRGTVEECPQSVKECPQSVEECPQSESKSAMTSAPSTGRYRALSDANATQSRNITTSLKQPGYWSSSTWEKHIQTTMPSSIKGPKALPQPRVAFSECVARDRKVRHKMMLEYYQAQVQKCCWKVNDSELEALVLSVIEQDWLAQSLENVIPDDDRFQMCLRILFDDFQIFSVERVHNKALVFLQQHNLLAAHESAEIRKLGVINFTVLHTAAAQTTTRTKYSSLLRTDHALGGHLPGPGPVSASGVSSSSDSRCWGAQRCATDLLNLSASDVKEHLRLLSTTVQKNVASTHDAILTLPGRTPIAVTYMHQPLGEDSKDANLTDMLHMLSGTLPSLPVCSVFYDADAVAALVVREVLSPIRNWDLAQAVNSFTGLAAVLNLLHYYGYLVGTLSMDSLAQAADGALVLAYFPTLSTTWQEDSATAESGSHGKTHDVYLLGRLFAEMLSQWMPLTLDLILSDCDQALSVAEEAGLKYPLSMCIPLIAQMCFSDPAMRPSIEAVLQHSFFKFKFVSTQLPDYDDERSTELSETRS